MFLRKNTKTFTINSKDIKNKIFLDMGKSQYVSIIDYINRNSAFMINFKEADMIYYSRALFKDHKLLQNIDYFMRIFEPMNELSDIEDEKQKDFTDAEIFDNNSLFGFVCNHFSNSEYLVCDDLGDEWADFISIHNNIIRFIHAKSGTEGLSATNFSGHCRTSN